MAKLDVNVLGSIVEKLPEDFSVEYLSEDGKRYHVSDNIEIDISRKTLILKS